MNKQIAEKLGWVLGWISDNNHSRDVWYPGTYDTHVELKDADFTRSMDACFTYLVPDMNKKGFYLTISQNPDGTWEAVWKENKMGINKALIGNDKEPEMAVCKAFMEV